MHNEKQVFLIKGKPVSKEKAFNKIKALVNKSKGIHIDGLSCDMDGLNQIFVFAEKNNASLDHMNGKNISKFLSIFQRTGGNIASLGEVQKRSDYLLFIGINKDFVKLVLAIASAFSVLISVALIRSNLACASCWSVMVDVPTSKFLFANSSCSSTALFSALIDVKLFCAIRMSKYASVILRIVFSWASLKLSSAIWTSNLL